MSFSILKLAWLPCQLHVFKVTYTKGNFAAPCRARAEEDHVSRKVNIAVNGAEYMELDAASAAATQSIPAYVRARCGLAPWPVHGAAMARHQEWRGSRPVRLALERHQITLALSDEEHATLDARDRLPNGPGLPLPQFVRTLLGFEVRFSSMPESDERVREEDDAWDRLQRLGLKPEQYFPPEA
jgi:hypothetical protein